MEDLRRKIEERHNWVQRLVDHIPGFNGYQAKEVRRDADKALRDHLVKQLSAQQDWLSKARLEMTNQLQLEGLDGIDRLGKRLETLTDRVRFADRGYAGFFDSIKVREPELDRVYELDNGTVDQIALVGKATEDVAAAASTSPREQLAAALASASAALETLDQQLKQRDSILSGIS